MKWIVTAGIAAVLLLLQPSRAAAGQMLPVISDAGRPLTMEVLAVGRFGGISESGARIIGTDNQGGDIRRHDQDRFQFDPGRTLPLAVGNGFGCRVKIPALPAGDTLSIDVRITPPDAPADPIEGRLAWDSSFSGQVRHIVWSFNEGNRSRHRAGQWTLSLANRGQMLITVHFQVVPP